MNEDKTTKRGGWTRAFPIFVLAGTLSSCTSDEFPPVGTRYAAAAQSVMQRYHVPGALVSVRYPGDPEWRVALGVGNIANRTPIEPRSHFSIRSITKSYTVTVLLQLVREGALSLEDKLETWIPGIPNGELITLADLAGMQSGIADYSATKQFQAEFGADVARAFTEQELVDFSIPGSPVFAPGARYEYSNTNTVLLGMIIERVTRAPLDEVLRARIFAPLRLTGTSYPSQVALPLPHATPYEVNVVTGTSEELPLINPTALAGAGAMESTLDDLATWALALGDGRLIGPDLQRERIDRSRVVTYGPEYDRYGLGIGILAGWWGHTGSGIGWQAAAFYDPRTGATIAVSINATPVGDRGDLNLAQEMFEALADVVATR
ncbi:MAG: beta-lactamase family protein [Burkholderiales bacterium]|nr:beta-lactamase family protein [Burkholderiales bacterium]